MPRAGDEGYEDLVICPYDKSHEIRKGRMQFHLEKCRRNHPLSPLASCPYNKLHLVPRQEMKYHEEEECDSRDSWDKYANEVETVVCPVKDLVPVNSATLPDCGENWDDFEASGSVLNIIKAEAENKMIYRMCQVAPKAERKEFRMKQRRRIEELNQSQKSTPKPDSTAFSDTTSVRSEYRPLPRPMTQPKNVPLVKQDMNLAVAAMNKQFKTMDLNTEPRVGKTAPSKASSIASRPPSEHESAVSTPRPMSFSYAAASKGAPNRPPSVMSSASSTATTMRTAPSRPPTAMSTSNQSFATAAPSADHDRPPSAMSNGSSVWSALGHRPPNAAYSRPSAAMNIAASAAAFRPPAGNDDGFCQIPIPGLGRGRRGPVPNNQ